MLLARFDENRSGAIVDGPSGPMVVDLAEVAAAARAPTELRAVVGDSWLPLAERWSEFEPALTELVRDAGAVPKGTAVRPVSDVRLRPPLPSVQSRIFALGANFRTHVADASQAVGQADPSKDNERPPGGFFVIPGSVVGHEDEVARPTNVQKLDYEAEVAVILASGGRELDAEDVRFWGYTAYNDVSVRDSHLGLSRLDEGSLSWALQKNFDGGNVVGPWAVVGELQDVNSLTIRSRVNGSLRQDGSTNQMIVSFAAGIAYLSRYLTLRPGDMLTSGTPGGTAIEHGIDGPYLQPGDLIEIEVEGVGVLRNRIVSR